MENARPDDGSFRDPAGQVYRIGDRVLRTVSKTGAADYEFVRDSNFLTQATVSDRVIGMTEVPPSELGGPTDGIRYLLEHPVLPFISYPYEWCFAALQSAALLQLDLMMEALEYDVTLCDASAYNVQFVGARPVFIDALSFRRYREGDYWTAHQQFCDQYLNPLLLTALQGIDFNAWYRGSLNGIPSEDLNRALSWHHKLGWRVLTHVTLPVRFQASARGNKTAQTGWVKTRNLPRSSMLHIISGLRNWITKLKPLRRRTSSWNGYAEDNPYDEMAADAKAEFTRRFAATVKPSMLWDIGCNTGVYTEIALQAGARRAIGFDSDSATVNAAFSRARAKNLSFLPLVVDAADPTPNQGWLGLERKSLSARANADGLLAYAVVHHLSIGRNIPLADVVAWLIRLVPEGIIEFVEKEDPMVRRMLDLRDDIFDNYRRDIFMAAIRRDAEIIDTKEVIEKRRVLVWYCRRTPGSSAVKL